MISESLYDIAFQFKKAKLWNKLYDSQLFAVAHSDGMIGYCCAMGMMGEHLALAVYPGAAGMDSYRMMGKDRDEMSELETMETALSQNCVMLSFENKEELRPRELAEVRAYCAARGLSLRGRKAFPQFQRFRPHYFPWYVTDEADQTHLYEALEAGLEVSAKLDETVPADLGFTEGPPFHRTIPLLRKENSGFAWETVPLPEPLPVVYPSAVLRYDIALAKLAKSKKRGGEWACDVFMHVDPMSAEEGADGIVVEPEDAPFYPYLLLIVDNKDGMVLGAQLSEEPEDYTEKFAQAILEVAQKAGKPSRILVHNDRAYALFEKAAAQLGAELAREAHIPYLEEAEQGFLEHFEGDENPLDDEMEQFMEGLRDPELFPGMPDALLMQLQQMERMGVLPGDAAENVRRESKRRGFK